MKKNLILGAFIGASLLMSCGGEKKEGEETAKKCKTHSGVEADCADIEAAKQVEELSHGFVSTSLLSSEEKEAAIKTNEGILEKMEPLMASLEKIIEIDPKEATELYVEDIAKVKKDIADHKQMAEDLKNISISASWEQDPKFPKEKDVAIRFKNTSTKPITYLGGKMTYLDAEGNVLAEGEIGLYSFHFEPKIEGDQLPAGYEGVSDHGINVEKEKRKLISTITIEINEIRYPAEQ